MSKKKEGMAVKPVKTPPQRVRSMYGQKTVVIKGVWITDDPQQNQQDGEPTRQAGDNQQSTAQQT